MNTYYQVSHDSVSRGGITTYPGAPCRPGRRMRAEEAGGAGPGLPRTQCLRLSQAVGQGHAHTLPFSPRVSLPLATTASSGVQPGRPVHSSRSGSCWVRCRPRVSLVVLDLGLAIFSHSADSQDTPEAAGSCVRHRC